MNELIKKLCCYSYDCIKESLKSNQFLNLKNDCLINPDSLKMNNQKLNKLLIDYKKNRLNKNIYYGKYFIKQDNNIYSPLIYADIEINQNNNNYEINYKSDFELNINLLINLLNNNDYEFIINTLLSCLDDDKKPDVLKALTGIETTKEENIIFSNVPDSTAGILNELKIICKEL